MGLSFLFLPVLLGIVNPAGDPRDFRVLGVASRGFRSWFSSPGDPDLWRSPIERRLLAASDLFERTAGIRLRPAGIETTDFPNSRTAESDALFRRAYPKEALAARKIDLVVLFSFNGSSAGAGGPTVSEAGFFEPWLVVRESDGTTDVEAVRTLVHELGHAFGLVHTTEESSFMSIGEKGARWDFLDEPNAAILRMTGPLLDFNRGIDALGPEAVATYSSLLREVARPADELAINPIAAGFVVRGNEAREAGTFAAAKRFYLRALDIEPRDDLAAFSLALLALFDLRDRDLAADSFRRVAENENADPALREASRKQLDRIGGNPAD